MSLSHVNLYMGLASVIKRDPAIVLGLLSPIIGDQRQALVDLAACELAEPRLVELLSMIRKLRLDNGTQCTIAIETVRAAISKATSDEKRKGAKS